MRTLDSYNLHGVSFIKMDVENFEDEVLDGAKKTLRENRPIIFLEIQGNSVIIAQQHTNRAKRVCQTISKLGKVGYRVTHFSGSDYIAFPN